MMTGSIDEASNLPNNPYDGNNEHVGFTCLCNVPDCVSKGVLYNIQGGTIDVEYSRDMFRKNGWYLQSGNMAFCEIHHELGERWYELYNRYFPGIIGNELLITIFNKVFSYEYDPVLCGELSERDIEVLFFWYNGEGGSLSQITKVAPLRLQPEL